MRTLPLIGLLAACGPNGGAAIDPTAGTGGTTQQPLPEGVTVEDGAVVHPHKIVTIDLDVAAGLWMACTLDSDPEEVLIYEDAAIADTHTFDLLGLAAGESYTCVATADGGQALTFAVDVGLVEGAPLFTVERDESVPMSGVWTIMNSTDGFFMNSMSRVILVDPEGRHRWVYEAGVGYVADLDTALTVDGDVHMGGGWGLLDEGQGNRGIFRTVKLDGTTVEDREVPAFGLGFNHHSEPMPDGTTLGLTTSWNGDGSHEWYGVAVERWDTAAQAPSFTWDTQGMIDAGQLTWPGLIEENPYHANSVTWIDDVEGPALMVSLYMAKEIWRVDRNTGLRTWTLGPGGDFALIDTNGSPLPSSKWFYVQHDPDWTEDQRVLVYDNGYERPGGDYSRVAELQLDTDAMTATLTWEWTETGWYDPVVGDADWLPNGNVLITKGFVIAWTPWSPDVSALVEVDPRTDEVAWRLKWPERDQAVFRSQRYDGCEVFANNTKHCAIAASRLEELRAGG